MFLGHRLSYWKQSPQDTWEMDGFWEETKKACFEKVKNGRGE